MKLLFVIMILWGSLIQAEVVNYETEGNLKSYHDIGCTGLDGLTNQYTPADILLGMRQCLIDGEYEKAAGMRLVASVYGKFDKLRVEEKTAHQALQMLEYNYFSQLDPKILEAYSEYGKNVTNLGSINCPTLYRIGKPDYHPIYMIAHGLTMFYDEPSADGLVAGFDGDKTWQDLLDNYAKCGTASNQNTSDDETVNDSSADASNELTKQEEPVSDSGNNENEEIIFTDFCIIEEEKYTIMSNNIIYEIVGEMESVGYTSEPLDENCVFDLIITSGRYCVDENGDVFADQEESLGVCQPCEAEACYQLISNPE